MTTLTYRPLTDEDLPAILALAQTCLDADGGLPELASEPLARALFVTPVSIGGWDELGDLVAVSALSHDSVGTAVSGLLHPSLRGQGIGEELAAWAREQHGQAPSPLRVIDEALSPEAEAFYASIGLQRTIAERIMVHRLKVIEHIPRPEGLRAEPFTEQTAPDFYTAFTRAFAADPHYRTDDDAETWLSWARGLPNFRPEESRVVYAGDEPVGFVLLDGVWLELVGVAPAWRGQALGAHLVVRSLSALKRAGVDRVYLAVNLDNPARKLYRRLGFRNAGTRARYVDAWSSGSPSGAR